MRRPGPTQVARPYTFPVATGGWNASDALDAMQPDEAETLVNWFPETTYPRLRRGFTKHCDTTVAEPVYTLAAYSAATDALLAAVGDTWFDVTTSTPASLATGFTETAWDWVNYGTAGGHYLLAVNGTDTPQVYNGATMVAAVNTVGGVAPAFAFSRVAVYNQRVYYARTGTARVYYLPVGQYQGALTEYDLGPLLTKGGVITKLATWTRDNAAAGANEMFVVVSDQGEVLIFTGDYPGAGAWVLSARFEVGLPVAGPGSVVRVGPDCVLLCEDGFQPMAHYLALGQSQASAVALSKKIGNAVTTAMRSYRLEDGWCATLYPAGNMLIFNVPQGDGVYWQFVVNTLTGAWCKWTGQNARSWVLHDAKPYFGNETGVVYRADHGTSDDGNNINAEYRGSYQYIGGEGVMKVAQMARPIFQATDFVTVNFGIDVDFNNTSRTTPATSTTSAAIWDVSLWDVGIWGSGMTLQANWVSVWGIGYALAPHFLVTANNIELNLMSISLTYQRGAMVG